MKMLFSSSDFAEINSVKKLLHKAGIPCEILNDAMSPAMVAMALYPELWLHDDEDFLAASVLLASARRKMVPAMQPIPLQQEYHNHKGLNA